jgi:hypothetical protein
MGDTVRDLRGDPMMTMNELLNLIEESKNWPELKRKIREHRDNELNITLSELKRKILESDHSGG